MGQGTGWGRGSGLLPGRTPADGWEAAVPQGLSAIREDVRSYATRAALEGGAHGRWALLTNLPLWALAAYRFGRAAYARPAKSVSGLAGRLAYKLVSPWISRLSRVHLPLQAKVGPHVWIGSGGPVLIAPGAEVGPGCALHGGNTLGVGGRGANRGVPRLGPGVQMSEGACVVGRVTVEARTVVGFNSTVVRSLKGPCLFGVPATSVSLEGHATPAQPAHP